MGAADAKPGRQRQVDSTNATASASKRQDRDASRVREQAQFRAGLDIAQAAHARDGIALMQEAIRTDARFQPLQEADPKTQRRAQILLVGPHPGVLHAGFDLQEADLHETGPVGHVRTIRLDGRDGRLITDCAGRRDRSRRGHLRGTGQRRAPTRERDRAQEQNGPRPRPPTVALLGGTVLLLPSVTVWGMRAGWRAVRRWIIPTRQPSPSPSAPLAGSTRPPPVEGS